MRLCPIGGEEIREEDAISGTLTIVAMHCSVDYFPIYFRVAGLNGTTFFLAI